MIWYIELYYYQYYLLYLHSKQHSTIRRALPICLLLCYAQLLLIGRKSKFIFIHSSIELEKYISLYIFEFVLCGDCERDGYLKTKLIYEYYSHLKTPKPRRPYNIHAQNLLNILVVQHSNNHNIC